MDLVAGAKRVVVAMQHVDRKGNLKLLEKCDLPLTGINCIDLVVSDYGVFGFDEDGFVLQEIAPGLSVDEVVKATGGPVKVHPDLKTMEF